MPPAAEPLREQLLAAVTARLAALTAGTTYWFTPAEATRDWKSWEETKAEAGKPGYGIIEGKEIQEDLTNTEVHVTHDVTVTGWIKEDQNRRTALNRAIADIVKAIYTDETWGLPVTAAWTNVVEIVTDEAALQSQGFAYFELTARVHYDRARTSV